MLAKLALEDGTVFTGLAFGASGEVDGEVVFNTSMTGYQEILTDPSYRGQIVTMTYPESDIPHLTAFIVRENSRIHSNFRSQGSLESFLKKHGIIGLEGIDTRALVRKIREKGAMNGVISTNKQDDASLIAKAKASQGLLGRDLVREVLKDRPFSWNEKLSRWWKLNEDEVDDVGQSDLEDQDLPHIVALDFGMKWNICRHLYERDCQVDVVPGTMAADEILARKPDGVFLSNGPGDPEPVTYAIETISQLLGKVPIFGICLGHQLLSLASGAKTFKMKFGHRGANQPVINLETGKIEITTQNHGFAVEESSLPSCLTITHRNLNDDTIAGVRHNDYPAFGVQHHPEASAGPHDSQYLFQEFRNLIDKGIPVA